MTSGHVHPILGRTGAGTMYHEIVDLVERGHEDVERLVTRNGSEIHVDIEEAKAALLKLVHESGVAVYLQTPMVEAVMEGDQLTGVLVGTQDGLRVIRAKAFVDATGDGLLAARAGATYVSPFVGRLNDVGMDGMGLIAEIKTIFDNYGFDTEIIVASVRSPRQVTDAAIIGADIATIPFKTLEQMVSHPQTDLGIAKFEADWANRK